MEIVWEPAVALTVPPAHVVLALGLGATIIPSVRLPGNGSVTDTFTKGTVFVFCNMILSVDMPPGLTVGGVKDLLTEISLTVSTVKLAVRGLGTVRFSLFVMFAGGMMLVCTPGVLLVTYTSMRQVVAARIVPLDKATVFSPVTAVITAEAPQLFCVAGEELLIVTSAGRSSTIEKLVKSVSAGAVMLMRKREFSPGRIVAGENDLFDEMPRPAVYTLTSAEVGIPFVIF